MCVFYIYNTFQVRNVCAWPHVVASNHIGQGQLCMEVTGFVFKPELSNRNWPKKKQNRKNHRSIYSLIQGTLTSFFCVSIPALKSLDIKWKVLPDFWLVILMERQQDVNLTVGLVSGPEEGGRVFRIWGLDLLTLRAAFLLPWLLQLQFRGRVLQHSLREQTYSSGDFFFLWWCCLFAQN